MKPSVKAASLILLTLSAIAATFMLKPVAQSPAYHNLADKRIFFDIRNCWNVVSNLPFLIVGGAGLASLKNTIAPRSIKLIYAFLFAGIVLTGFGSAWYHYTPGNDTLVYDRLPMTLVFMSLVAAVIAAHIDLRTGVRLLFPLLIIGIGSVLWWKHTEQMNKGDLRLYGVVQFYPMILLPLIVWMYPLPAYRRGLWQLVWVIAWYVGAKLFERFDYQIYTFTGFVSGHSLKHLAAAMATWHLVKMFRYNYPAENPAIPAK